MGTTTVTDIIQLAPAFVIGASMFSDYAIFYQTLSEGMNDMLISIDSNLDAIEKVMEIEGYIIDLQQNLTFDVNLAVINIEPVMRGDVYKGLITLPRYRGQVYPGVLALNEHTKKYINSDLTDFVNNDVWNESCVPYEWAIASEITGENISGWNVCEPS